MQNQAYYKDRYPGLRSFEKNQSALFFGREQEIEDLYSLVSTEKTVVFFGKSGLGKSSLLEAGLSPLLEKSCYHPIRVRFSPGSMQPGNNGGINLLVNDFLSAFNGLNNEDAIVFDRDAPQLWEYIKAAKFKDAEGKPAIPVFIFDQFEEFFYQPKAHQEAFLKQLAEVIHDQPPRRVLEWITAIEPGQRTPVQMQWYRQPELKVIFALRSDKLSLMQLLTQYMPGAMRTRYELKPLNKQQAGEAIKMPAQKDMGNGYTPPFGFKEALLGEIVNELGSGSNEIESSQLQMVCSYIENQVKEKAAAGSPVTEVTNAIIEPAADIQLIRDNFYENQLLQNIAGTADRELAKKIIEDDLVVDGQRASLLATQLLARFDGKKELVDALLKARLIREENTLRGLTYEVSHDTLVPSIEKSKRKRLATEADLKREEEWNKAAAEAARLRREADEKNALYEEQKRLWQKAEKEKKKAGRYLLVATILGVLAFAGGVYFFIDRQREAVERKNANRAGALLNRKTKELDSMNSLFNKYMLLDLEGDKNGSFTAKDTIAWDILQRARFIDTQYNQGQNAGQIDNAIEKLYKKTIQGRQKMNTVTIDADTGGGNSKLEYLQKAYPNVAPLEQTQQPEDYKQQWENSKRVLLNKKDFLKKDINKN